MQRCIQSFALSPILEADVQMVSHRFTIDFTKMTEIDYEIHYSLTNDETQLPRSLHNPCDSRLGLRSRVIRLFFLRCPALVQRIKPPVAPRYEPYTLQGMQLVLAWHEVRIYYSFQLV